MSRQQVRQLGPVAINLRAAQAEAGLTTEALARELDSSVRTVQRWRLSEGEPSGEYLVKLAVVLGREPGWFYSEPQAAA